MTPEAVVAPPPTPIITSFPASIAVAATVIGSVVLLLVAARYDHTGGVLTISLLIILAFLGFIAFAMLVICPERPDDLGGDRCADRRGGCGADVLAGQAAEPAAAVAAVIVQVRAAGTAIRAD